MHTPPSPCTHTHSHTHTQDFSHSPLTFNILTHSQTLCPALQYTLPMLKTYHENHKYKTTYQQKQHSLRQQLTSSGPESLSLPLSTFFFFAFGFLLDFGRSSSESLPAPLPPPLPLVFLLRLTFESH